MHSNYYKTTILRMLSTNLDHPSTQSYPSLQKSLTPCMSLINLLANSLDPEWVDSHHDPSLLWSLMSERRFFLFGGFIMYLGYFFLVSPPKHILWAANRLFLVTPRYLC